MAKKFRCNECGKTTENAYGVKEGAECGFCFRGEIEKREPRTNREVLRDLVEDGDEMTLVFMRERLNEVTRAYLETPIEELREEFGKSGLFAPGFADHYIRAAQEVKEAVNF